MRTKVNDVAQLHFVHNETEILRNKIIVKDRKYI